MHGDESEMIVEMIKKLMVNYAKVGSQILALETVAAKTLQELASMTEEPDGYMLKLTSEIRGLGDAIARETNVLASIEGFDTSELTRTLERLCYMAETKS